MVEFTGERLVPGHVDQDLLNEHLARYHFAARLARYKQVLDIACGTGYGSAELAKVAAHVVGLDISEEAVRHAAETYQAPNLQFVASPAQCIPFDDGSFDLIVAFEVIEHLEDWPALLQQARRLLAPGGQFIVSTPNKAFYAETRRLSGPNPYHVHEFDFEEFRDALAGYFPSVSLFLQNHVEAIAFHPSAGGGVLIAGEPENRKSAEPSETHFFVAVCALSPQTGAPVYLFLPSASNLLREREHHILKLESELSQKDEWLDQLKVDHAQLKEAHDEQTAELTNSSNWALGLEADLKKAGARIVQLQEEFELQQRAAATQLAAYEAWIAALQEPQRKLELELEAKVQELSKCVELLHAAEHTVEERTEWAHQLQERIAQIEATLHAARNSRWFRLGRSIGVGPSLQNP